MSYQITNDDLRIAESGVRTQFSSTFDPDTITELNELGIQKFIDKMIQVIASQHAQIRFYSSCLHPKD